MLHVPCNRVIDIVPFCFVDGKIILLFQPKQNLIPSQHVIAIPF